MDLSIVITSYNTSDYLAKCLSSIFASTDIEDFEVFVVDNDSKDDSVEMVARDFPKVHLIANDANLGFAKANNRALSETQGRYVLLLNPDTELRPTTLAEMVSVMDARPDVGLAGLKLLRQDGEMDVACRRGFPTPFNSLTKFLRLDRIFPKSRIFGGYNLSYKDPDGDYEVDSIVGAFMFLRREVLHEVGLLDENYFMFGEDIDWCYRIKRSDWKVLYLGSKEILHVKGASVSQNQRAMNSHFHQAMYIFHKTHLVQKYPFFINWLVSLGIAIRWAFRSLALRFRR